MKLESRQLRYFVAVAEELHFGRAAERLNMSQPPLSQQIRQLEQQLQSRLFERSQRSVRLTSAGELLLAQAHGILSRLDVTAELVQAAVRGEAGLLRLGYTAASAYGLVPALIRAYKQRYPAVEVILHEMLSREQVVELSQKRLDVGLVRPLATRPELETRPLMAEPLILALPAHHPLASCDIVRVQQLDGLALIGFTAESASYFHDMVSAMLMAAGIRPVIVQRATQPHTVISLVASGLGVAIVPQASARIHMEGVVYRPLPAGETPQAEIHLCWRQDRLTPLVQSFLSTAQEVMAS